MWDINTIIEQNNQAALDYMQRGHKVQEAQVPLLETWPLTMLAMKMKSGPPQLNEIIECFTRDDAMDYFQKITHAFLPEQEAEIIRAPRSQRLYKFCFHFGKRYFPLPPYSSENYMSDFVRNMPVMLMAMSYSAYHNLSMRSGYLLLLSLVVYPYEGDERDLEEDDMHDVDTGGGRVPVLDAVLRLVGENLANLIPPDGWTPKELRQMTDKTPYDGVGHFADWVCGETGCVVLDSSYDDCDYTEGDGAPRFMWSRYNVDALTEQWPRVQEYRAKIDRVVEWLESDAVPRFQEMLEFLLLTARALPKRAKKTIRYHDPYDPVKLEQSGGDDDEEEACDELTRF
jgi:hypothetical protein